MNLPILTYSQIEALRHVSQILNIPVKWLFAVINYESGFNPQIKNPASNSSARGLIQFTNDSAKKLGYTDSLDLVQKNPTIESQLLGPVLKYFKQYSPFANEKEFFLSVFVPAFRRYGLYDSFPVWVRESNPGINTPHDYIKRVWAKTGVTVGGYGIIGIGIIAALIWAMKYI